MSGRPRLLIVATVEPTIHSFLLPYADHFRSLGWQVDGMAQGIEGAEECHGHFDEVWEVGWVRNPLAFQKLAAAHARVRRVAAERDYSIVHVHTPVASFVTRHALREQRPLGLRVAYTAHGFHFHSGGKPLSNFGFRTMERFAARWTDALVVINGEDYQAARSLGTIDPERVHFMPGIGVDVAAYRDAATDEEASGVRNSLGIPRDAFTVLMIAEFNRRKRHEDALRAFAAAGDPNAHLVLVGRGALMDTSRDLARRLGIMHRTHFLGYRRDVPVLIRASDVTILPSNQEGLPRSIMESMSAGTPVIGSDIRGVRDLLGDGAGLLFPVGNVEELARRIDWLRENPAAARTMAGVAKQRIERYDVRNLLGEHERLYENLLTAGPP